MELLSFDDRKIALENAFHDLIEICAEVPEADSDECLLNFQFSVEGVFNVPKDFVPFPHFSLRRDATLFHSLKADWKYSRCRVLFMDAVKFM